MSIRIAISIGDFNGVGPEVIIKTLRRGDLQNFTPVVIGCASIIDEYLALLKTDLSYHVAASPDQIKESEVNILQIADEPVEVKPGKLTPVAGKLAMEAVEKGIELCQTQQADALVTAPISKEAIHKAGYQVPGHTEFLAEKTGSADFMMMLVSGSLRVGLATVHVPLMQVPSLLNEEEIIRYLHIMNRSLHTDFGITEPEIAILGLNPHAGDGGVIGSEETEYITPAIQKMQFDGLNVKGPFPADSFFGSGRYKAFDGILAMYHDQGLIPFKTLSFGKGVNFTAGLPIIRTSPDHGTAFSIAGKGKADEGSFSSAFTLAKEMARNRRKETA